ncbi:MAG: S-layer homology domain-containing protein [Candidatus Peribacteraceae bacterium]|nr:S-layer homology domain-containing protein [Candidatus Peribacteraceae bacterium]
MSQRKYFLSWIITLAVLFSWMAVAIPARAEAAGSFSDVPESNPAFAAIEYVKGQGIMTGNPNGTFAPAGPFTRAASAKVLVLTKMSEADVQAVTERTFGDIPEGAWYRVYAEAARIKGIVSAAASFNGDRTVKKAEFLKMLLSSQGADPNAFSEIRLPLATDVTDPDAWFYPWMRRGITD